MTMVWYEEDEGETNMTSVKRWKTVKVDLLWLYTWNRWRINPKEHKTVEYMKINQK